MESRSVSLFTLLLAPLGLLPLLHYLLATSPTLSGTLGWRKSLYLALYRNPTVFWLASSDLALKLVCALGATAAALLVVFPSLHPLWWLISVCRFARSLSSLWRVAWWTAPVSVTKLLRTCVRA
jgi:hypothetical protein